MARPRAVFAIGLAAVLALAGAANTDVITDIEKAGATSWLEVIKAAGAMDAMRRNSPVMGSGLVVLAPTNKAVNTFLTSSGLEKDALLGRKALAQRVAGYLTLLPTQDLSKLKDGAIVNVPTANTEWKVDIIKGANGKLTVVDNHNDKATLTPTASPNVYLIDRVVLPGNVFPALSDLTLESPYEEGTMLAPFTLYLAAVDRLRAYPTLKAAGTTQFVPTDTAFKAAGYTKDKIAKADPAMLERLLNYHQVAGYNPVGSFPNSKPVPTLLKGATITVTTNVTPAAPGSNMTVGESTVTDAAGKTANIIASNYFAGMSTIHGIDRVLTPPPAGAGGKGGEAMTAAPKAGAGAKGGDVMVSPPKGAPAMNSGVGGKAPAPSPAKNTGSAGKTTAGTPMAPAGGGQTAAASRVTAALSPKVVSAPKPAMDGRRRLVATIVV